MELEDEHRNSTTSQHKPIVGIVGTGTTANPESDNGA